MYASGQTLFLHHQVPGLVAKVCGMVVGVTPKEDQVSYEVDDGTSVLRIIETRKSLRQNRSHPLQAATGTGATSTASGGIPECYTMPPQSRASTSASRLDSQTANRFLAPMLPRFEVGDIVKCTGKIQIDRSGDRFLFAHRLQRCEDFNAECQHQLDAIEIEKRLYRRSFDWNRLALEKAVPSHHRPAPHRTAANVPARQLISDLSQDGKAVSAPAIEFEPEQDDFAKRRLSPDKARRLLLGHASSSQSQSDSAPAQQIPSSPSSEHSRLSHTSESGSRQLRTHGKIPDRQLTEAYFQLQLQQHISQQYRSQAFTISDLQSDADLSALARRLVRIRLQHRHTSRSGDSSNGVSLGTTEQQAEKVRRLFEWAVRKMMQDGFIALADIGDPGDRRASKKGVASTADSYRLVTPEYLLRPLQKLLGTTLFVSPQDAASQDVDALATRLRILDDRFRFVDRSLVQDSLALYFTRYAPIVID
uniref:CST complex subunit STN1 n=1 Tax=Kalmanozyma brasiliensis (strain GHG001) TaxID=1365824 RepID=V5EY47_KALBG